MKRIILFSAPTELNLQEMLSAFFPSTLKDKVFAYMPSDGADIPQKYIEIAKGWALQNNATFIYINNALIDSDAVIEINKLMTANILCITGGNTFTLLRNLRRSGLDKAIIKFVQKQEYVLGGFSAGAIVLTPTIRVAHIDGFEGNDENTVDLKDLSGLNIVNFEVFPHYTVGDEKWAQAFEKMTGVSLRRIDDNELVVIDQ